MGRDLVWAQGFGWADVERGIPAGVNTIYRTGSISKSFTAVALLQLWERGFLDLDGEVKGLKEWPKDERPPVLLTFVSFRLMVALGTYFILVTVIGFFLRNKLMEYPLYL